MHPLALLLACARPVIGTLPEHHLAFGGDLMLGQQLNRVLDDGEARRKVFADLTLLRTADLSLVNGEGVIAAGGVLAGKGEVAPHTWRVRPAAIDMLVEAGIDVVAQGNNHAGDYGPAAQRETIQRLRSAGLDATGAGLNLADARTPVYRTVGDTVVAIIGIDLTGVRAYGAGPDTPGTFTANGEDPAAQDEIVDRLMAAAARAREHAHVVLLTPHWGPNWRTEPLPILRTLARRLIEAGYDGILGHSAHTLQGVELIHGKPVIYDAGNIALTYDYDDAAHRGILYDLSFTRAGITAVEAHPLTLKANLSRRATGRKATRILDEWDERTSAMGTAYTDSGAARRITCTPGWVEGPWGTPEPPVRTADHVELAPEHRWVSSLPIGATPADVRWANGVRLVGYSLLVPAVAGTKAAQVVTLYLTAEAPLPASLELTLRATNGRGTEYDRHQPGDWGLPADQWLPGRILVDRALFAFSLDPATGIRFDAGLREPPVFSTLPVVDRLVTLGAIGMDPRAPRLATLLARPWP